MAYKIMIDSGHGGADPGAVHNGRQEKDDNLALAMAVGDLLSRQGVDVVYTRTTDLYQTPFEKAQLANQSGADFFISFHRNSSEEPNQYSGVETLIYDHSGIKQTMAENIDGALAALGFQDLGVKARPGLVVLRRTRMPSLLIETGFLNTDADNALYDQKQQEIAVAIANAILGTLDLETIESDSRPQTRPAPEASRMETMRNGDGSETRMRSNDGAASAKLPSMEAHSPVTAAARMDSDAPERLYRVQTGLFRIRQNADNLLYELLDKGYPAFILSEDGFYKVQVGAYRRLDNAILMEQRLRRDGYATLVTT